MGIIQALSGREDWSPEADRFHRLWHLDQCWLSDDDRSYFHLFHGHIFGLHPACADFVETPTGRQLIGEWLASGHEPRGGQPVGVSAEDSAPEFEQLLGGLQIAVAAYAVRQQETADLRRPQPPSVGGSTDFQRIEEQQIERQQGRRRPGR